MKTRFLDALTFLIVASAPAVAQDVLTYVWDPGCNRTMTTNHFILAPGQEAEIYLDFSECTDKQIGSLLFFGYHTTKNRSRQLSAKDKVQLYMSAVYESGNLTPPKRSDTGSMLVDVASISAKGCKLMAKNVSRNKEIKIRLRAQLIAP